jgi:hypothetical protein
VLTAWATFPQLARDLHQAYTEPPAMMPGVRIGLKTKRIETMPLGTVVAQKSPSEDVSKDDSKLMSHIDVL